jgi:hypothetical protein
MLLIIGTVVPNLKKNGFYRFFSRLGRQEQFGHEPTTTVADEKHLGCRLTGKRRRTAERGP